MSLAQLLIFSMALCLLCGLPVYVMLWHDDARCRLCRIFLLYALYVTVAIWFGRVVVEI